MFILDIGAANNIMQLLRVPCWRDYLFYVLKAVRGSDKDVSATLWNSLLPLLVIVTVNPLENTMYASAGNQVSEEANMKAIYDTFGAVREYDCNGVRERAYEKGLLADFYVAVSDRLKILLVMPGDKVGRWNGKRG